MICVQFNKRYISTSLFFISFQGKVDKNFTSIYTAQLDGFCVETHVQSGSMAWNARSYSHSMYFKLPNCGYWTNYRGHLKILYRICKTNRSYMVPPAFTEVWQLMLQCIFKNFEHYRYHHAQPIISQHQCLKNTNQKYVIIRRLTRKPCGWRPTSRMPIDIWATYTGGPKWTNLNRSMWTGTLCGRGMTDQWHYGYRVLPPLWTDRRDWKH